MKLAGIEAYGMPKVGHGALEGKKVFCSDMTFDATVNPVVYEGGEPVFIDTEYDTWNMDPEALEKAFEIYPDTKVVVIAHLYGTPGKIEELNAVIRKHGAILIEDAAESMGATYENTYDASMEKEVVIGVYCILLMPYGCLLPVALDKRINWKRGLVIGMGTSFVIELLQLITCRGLFEFDDIIHNGFGCMMGAVLGSWCWLRMLKKFKMPRKPHAS